MQSDLILNFYKLSFKSPLNLHVILYFNATSNKFVIRLYKRPYAISYALTTHNFFLSTDLSSFMFLINPRGLKQIYFLNSWFAKKINSLICTFYAKIKFKGKGYRIYSSLNSRYTLTYVFGHSHLILLPLLLSKIFMLTKTKLLLISMNFQNLFFNIKKILATKPMNIFTSRGIRLSKQLVYKKTGKVSSYR